MSSDELEAWRWMVSDEGAQWLQLTGDTDTHSPKIVAQLRKHLSAERAALILDQAHLRRVAAKKFTRAAEMFFHRLALEQATDEWIARYKAQRFDGARLIDACCGIGGDLL